MYVRSVEHVVRRDLSRPTNRLNASACPAVDHVSSVVVPGPFISRLTLFRVAEDDSQPWRRDVRGSTYHKRSARVCHYFPTCSNGDRCTFVHLRELARPRSRPSSSSSSPRNFAMKLVPRHGVVRCLERVDSLTLLASINTVTMRQDDNNNNKRHD